MTAGEVVALVTALGVPVASALIAIGVYLGKREKPAEAQPRETSLPPSPSLPRSPTIPDADLEALRGRMVAMEARQTETATRVEAEAQRAQNFRERVLTKLARIAERLRITEENDADRRSE